MEGEGSASLEETLPSLGSTLNFREEKNEREGVTRYRLEVTEGKEVVVQKDEEIS